MTYAWFTRRRGTPFTSYGPVTSIKAGTVLIVLAGRFKGRRVVCLGQLPSGLLLVTGPYEVNGVPLRRVNQAYVIATSTKVSTGGFDIKSIDEKMFAKPKRAATRKGQEKFFGQPEKRQLDASFVALQKKVDAGIAAEIQKDETLKSYFRTRFSLGSHDRPHLMKF